MFPHNSNHLSTITHKLVHGSVCQIPQFFFSTFIPVSHVWRMLILLLKYPFKICQNYFCTVHEISWGYTNKYPCKSETRQNDGWDVVPCSTRVDDPVKDSHTEWWAVLWAGTTVTSERVLTPSPHSIPKDRVLSLTTFYPAVSTLNGTLFFFSFTEV